MLKIIVLAYFKKQLKPLAKKFPSLKDSIIVELESFDANKVPHLGNNLYKLRITAKELLKGKSKSFRLIVLVIEHEGYLVPVTFYFKGDRASLSTRELNQHLEYVLFELTQND